MSVSRPRKTTSDDLPANLYEQRPGYFVYVNRLIGKAIAVGRVPRKDAIKQAIEANQYVEAEQAQTDILAKIQASTGATLADWLSEYAKIQSRRNLAATTQRQLNWKRSALEAKFGRRTLAELAAPRIWADWIDGMIEAGKHGAAVNWKSYVQDVWREAIAQGWATTNPIMVLRSVPAGVKRARMTLDGFRVIYAAAAKHDPWLQRAMELAIITGQRREDLAAMQFRKRADASAWIESGTLYVRQGKTGAQLAIPLDLRLDSLDLTLSDVVAKCRDAVVSPWLLHQIRHQSRVAPGDALSLNRLTKGFAKARDSVPRFWPEGIEPPTFHEMRSLSIRLWTDQAGAEFAQALAGHKDAATTAVYRDVRGSEWTKIIMKTG
jgi:integrase